jgi:hypothetical protein
MGLEKTTITKIPEDGRMIEQKIRTDLTDTYGCIAPGETSRIRMRWG